jgi:hypothetical protein
MTFRSLALAFIAAIALQPAAMANPFVPKSDLWSVWDLSDEQNEATIDHQPWQALLEVYLDASHPSGISRFDYAALTDADQDRLGAYVVALASLDPREYSRAEQKAYWINLYNALTVDLVQKKYPVESIKKIYGGLLGLGPWNRELVEIAGEMLSLNDIEHRILRPIYQDPRIHYAVNCASLGCPNLSARAFTAANTDDLLEAAARNYINHPRGASFDDRGRLRVSSIFDWYQIDFGGSEAGVIAHLRGHAEPELAGRLEAYDGRLRYGYDWALNAP